MARNKKNKTKIAAPKPKVTKELIIICSVVTVIIALTGAFIGTVMDYSASSDGEIKTEYISEAMELVTTHPSWIITSLLKKNSKARLVTFMGLFAWGLFLIYKYSEDTRRTHRKGVEHGSAKWGDDKEKKTLNKEKQTEKIIMKDSDGNPMYDENDEFLTATSYKSIILSEDVQLALNTWNHKLNLNVLIVGGSGAGKTRAFAQPNIMQLSTSYVITDPKGEILQSTGKMLEQAGYKVRVLNLIEMNHSNNYNPFHYVYDNNGDLSEDNVKKMVDCLFKNTKGDGEKTDFWSQKGQSLLEAIVFLLFEESEYNGEYEEIKDESTGKTSKRFKPESRDLSHLNFFSVTEKMRKLNYPPKGSKVQDGFFLQRNPDETEEEFRERQSQCFLCPLDKDFIELEKRKGDTLAGRLYKEVRNAPEETGQSFLSSANVKTFFFNLTNLRNLTCCDNIHLETLGDEKTALFILIPATSRTYNFVAAMMYTQMFDVLSNRANFKYGGVLPVHVRCIMDEFYNIGEIPDFDVVIGFVRSMGISLNVILQNLAQIKSKYEKTWEIITGNCSSFLFLGGTEDSTLEYLSKQLGKETIDVRSLNKTRGKSPSTSESNSIMGRELMMPNEIKTMPNTDCILSMQYHNPFYCNKYMQENHPNFKYLAGQGINDSFLVSKIHSVTVEEFEQQFIRIDSEKKVDTNINFSEKEKSTKEQAEENNEERNQKMTTVFKTSSPSLTNEEQVVLTKQDSDDYEYDEDAIAKAISEVTSENVVEEYTSRFGEVSDFDCFDLGEPKNNTGGELYDETDISVSVESAPETHYAEVTNEKEEVQITEEFDVEVISTETYFNASNDFSQDDTFGFF